MTTGNFHNELSGATRDVVQAGHVAGGVHFHRRESDSAEPLPPRQLPADVRGFVNRTDELDRLDLLLTSDEPAATYVIAGTAGVGKTSLAIHWAHRVAGSFPDGQLYVNLHGYDPGPPVTPGEVLDRFLRALNVPATAIPADLEPRAALYRSRLAGRRVLIVLDNAATADQVRPLIAPEAEHVALPDPTAAVAPTTFDGYGAARLWFAREERNLYDAVHIAEDVLMHDLAWLLAALLYPVYANRNQFDHWIASSTVGLGATRQLGNPTAEARMLESLGKANVQTSNLPEGIRFQQAALAIHERLGDRTGAITSTNAIGLAHLRVRELPDALAHFERTRVLAEELDSDYWRALSANNTANALLELERFTEAEELLRTALRILESLGTRGDEGDALRGLSRARRELGAPHEAQELVDRALAIAREYHNIAWEAQWLIELGHVLVALDELPEALTACQRAAVLHRRLADRSREATALDCTGIVYRLMSRPDEAADFHRMAAATFRETGERWRLALALTNLGAALRAPEAAEHYREALDLLAAYPDPRLVRLQQEIRDRLG